MMDGWTMKLFDTFLFFNELDLLEIRLNVLAPYVDYFVITEADVTFSGKPKPFYYYENRARYRDFAGKIIYNRIDSTPDDFSGFIPPNKYFTDRMRSYAHKSNGTPLSRLSPDFQREVYQRDSIINGPIGAAADEDLILISDLDEIPNTEQLVNADKKFKPGMLYNFCMKWLMYYLNVECSDEWFGTRVCRFDYLDGKSIDLMRYHLENRLEQPVPIVENGGWHFSFLGGQDRVMEKLAAYSYQGRRSRYFLRLLDSVFKNRVAKKIARNEDIFNKGRRFLTLEPDSSLPRFILENRDRYCSYIKGEPQRPDRSQGSDGGTFQPIGTIAT